MPHPALRRIPRSALAVALGVALAFGAAACGDGEKRVKLSDAVDSANEALRPLNAKMDCPDEVDQDTTGFDCTVQGTNTGKTATFKAILTGENRDMLVPADQSALQAAVNEVTK